MINTVMDHITGESRPHPADGTDQGSVTQNGGKDVRTGRFLPQNKFGTKGCKEKAAGKRRLSSSQTLKEKIEKEMPAIVDKLISLTSDKDAKVRIAATKALLELRTSPSLLDKDSLQESVIQNQRVDEVMRRIWEQRALEVQAASTQAALPPNTKDEPVKAAKPTPLSSQETPKPLPPTPDPRLRDRRYYTPSSVSNKEQPRQGFTPTIDRSWSPKAPSV